MSDIHNQIWWGFGPHVRLCSIWLQKQLGQVILKHFSPNTTFNQIKAPKYCLVTKQHLKTDTQTTTVTFRSVVIQSEDVVNPNVQ